MIMETVLIINSVDHTQTSKGGGLVEKKILSGKRGKPKKVMEKYKNALHMFMEFCKVKCK